jgi:hypothetical protein
MRGGIAAHLRFWPTEVSMDRRRQRQERIRVEAVALAALGIALGAYFALLVAPFAL